MARPPRFVEAGAWYHGTARGVDGQRIYRADDDFERFLHLLDKVARRFRWFVFAFCLMPNHYHLVVGTPIPNLPAGMQYLNGVYAQGFNRRYCRIGHLFQARYDARVIEDESYLENTLAYVVANPVRAGLCTAVIDWPWSWTTFGRGI